MIVLSTITNQYGEEIEERKIYFDGEFWKEESINCYSSSDLGLGTCRCINHPAIREEIVSRDYVLSIIKQNPEKANELTPAEIEDLKLYQDSKLYKLKCKIEEANYKTIEEIKRSIEVASKLIPKEELLKNIADKVGASVEEVAKILAL